MFAKCFVVNLDRRPDRFEEFQSRISLCGWPFREPQRWRGIDGKEVPHPGWWKCGGGAWGCLRSHAAIIEACISDNVDSVLILEDDAFPCEGFAEKSAAFLSAVPKDWGIIYLGGQHLFAGSHPPKRINDLVYRPYNVNRTHAFALSRSGMRIVYPHLFANDWKSGHHIDHHLGRLHMANALPVYCPREWLVGQAPTKSDINGRTPGLRFWQDAKEVSPEARPFVAIVGLHSSGSSVVAGICWTLGLHLGNKFGGFYKIDTEHKGFEAVGLARICEQAAKFPNTKLVGGYGAQLKRWIEDRQREASRLKKLCGGKYPTLCRMGEQLQYACGDRLIVIHCSRPLEESIESLKRRQGHQASPPPCSPEAAEALQRWLWEGKREFLADIPQERQLTVEYANLLDNPLQEIEAIVSFLDLKPTEAQVAAAVCLVKPEARHVKL